MISDEIRSRLFAEQDTAYRDFQAKLMPTVDPEAMIGVRTPVLRKMAKEYAGRAETADFLEQLPHQFFDEMQLHAFIISECRDYDECIGLTERFLSYIDNWATCDQLSPKVFRKHRQDLLTHIRRWLESDKTYTVRFGIGMLMEHFLDGDYDRIYPETVAAIRSDEYYINMMIAWYFATALAKQYESVLPFIEDGSLDTWTHNKAIQKAIESRRITPEQKEYLRGLKR